MNNDDENRSLSNENTNDVPPYSIFDRAYDGSLAAKNATVSSIKTLGRLGIKSVKFVGRHTGNALNSASLATGFHRITDPVLSLSPLAKDRKLQKYSKSYNLNGYMNLAKDTAKKLNDIKPIAHTIDTDGNRTIDILKLGSVGEVIKKHITVNPNNKNKIDAIAKTIGDISAEAKLTGKEGLQGKYLALHQEIQKNSEKYHTPTQIIAAFSKLKEKTLQDLEQQKKDAIARIKSRLEPTSAQLTTEQQDLSILCNINQNANIDEIKRKLSEKVNQIVEHIEKEYVKAKANIDEYFDGKPAPKNNDKEIPAILGLDAKLENEKERAEADLLLRINHLERMIMRDYDIRMLDSKSDADLVATIGGEEAIDKDFRARCLKDITLSRLLNEKWEGKYWGNKQVANIHTRNGFTMTTREGTTEITGLKLPPQWFFTDTYWEQQVQIAAEDYIGALKINMEAGENLSLTINHEVDNNRHMSIAAIYRAARKQGFKPEQIIFTVNGSKEEKGNFEKKPALEVLKACGLDANDPLIEEDLAKISQEKQTLNTREKQQAMRTNVGDLKFNDSQKSIEDYLKDNDTSAGPKKGM